ncbi:MAG TPA: hypothetical protein VG710_17780 [Opitutus sp.]|nr:hypothetical protein [Opitutus sp.]
MPQHFALHASAALVGIIAFGVAAGIFVGFTWHALGMTRRQVERLARLPFADRTDLPPRA